MLIDYGRGEEEAVISVATMMVYEQQFHSDIIQDLFGRSVIRRKDDSEDILLEVDYRDVNWTALVRVLWAALKTADETYPSFREWSLSLGPIDLNDLSAKLIPEAYGQFFRAGAAGSE